MRSQACHAIIMLQLMRNEFNAAVVVWLLPAATGGHIGQRQPWKATDWTTAHRYAVVTAEAYNASTT